MFAIQRPTRTSWRAFTFTELLVVMAVVGVLLAVLLPAISAARETARRAGCQNNLKQIGLALINHENAARKLPIGAKSNVTFGVSWWVGVLPYLDESGLHRQLDLVGAHNGSPLLHGQNGSIVDRLEISTMACPSSPLDLLWPVGSFRLMMPSYVGIAGASNHQVYWESRVSPCCVSDGNTGQISAGGLLIPNRGVSMREILDGASKTLLAGEASDQAIRPGGAWARIDGGNPHGWITGTSATGTPPDYNPGFAPPSWNISTIRYGPNTRDYSLPGIGANHGANNPLISPHAGGVFGVLADGSVQFSRTRLKSMYLNGLPLVMTSEPSRHAGLSTSTNTHCRFDSTQIRKGLGPPRRVPFFRPCLFESVGSRDSRL